MPGRRYVCVTVRPVPSVPSPKRQRRSSGRAASSSLIVTVNVAVVPASTSAGASSAMTSGAVGVVRLNRRPNPRGWLTVSNDHPSAPRPLPSTASSGTVAWRRDST
nr:hypothetical protein [Salinibacter ruber]